MFCFLFSQCLNPKYPFFWWNIIARNLQCIASCTFLTQTSPVYLGLPCPKWSDFFQVFLPKLCLHFLFIPSLPNVLPIPKAWFDPVTLTNLGWADYNLRNLLGAFTKLRKATGSFVKSVSICRYATTQLPLDRFSRNVIFEYF